jgi:hypothetical protein
MVVKNHPNRDPPQRFEVMQMVLEKWYFGLGRSFRVRLFIKVLSIEFG